MDAALRSFVRQRARNRCEYCRMAQEHQPFARFHIDHIRPSKHHGSGEPSNLALACRDCNLYRSSNIAGIEADTNQMVRLFNPRQDEWDEHFEWDGPKLRGKTPIGRATIDVLAINTPARIRLREELIGEGVFPR